MWVKIYMAGNIATAQRVCQTYVDEIGLCVTVEPSTYVYTGGSEEGFVVGLINYPRFPTSHIDELVNKAEELGKRLMLCCAQQSFTIMSPTQTIWYSDRKEDNKERDNNVSN